MINLGENHVMLTSLNIQLEN